MLEIEVSAKDRHEIKAEIVELPDEFIQELDVLRRIPAKASMFVNCVEERAVLVVAHLDDQSLSELTAPSAIRIRRENVMTEFTSNHQRQHERSSR